MLCLPLRGWWFHLPIQIARRVLLMNCMNGLQIEVDLRTSDFIVIHRHDGLERINRPIAELLGQVLSRASTAQYGITTTIPIGRKTSRIRSRTSLPKLKRTSQTHGSFNALIGLNLLRL